MAAGSGVDMAGLGKGAARGPWNSLLVRHLEQAVQGDGLVSPEPSGQVGPIPVTQWGHTQESHHHICGLCLGEIQQGPVQPLLSRLIGHEPLVNVSHHGRHLQKVQGDLERCQRESCPASPEKCSPSHHTAMASKAHRDQQAQVLWEAA